MSCSFPYSMALRPQPLPKPLCKRPWLRAFLGEAFGAFFVHFLYIFCTFLINLFFCSSLRHAYSNAKARGPCEQYTIPAWAGLARAREITTHALATRVA